MDFQANTSQVPASPAVKGFVLRIVQEFLQNSLKHSGCSRITLRMQHDDGGLEILASDDGKGFTTGEKHTGIGLDNMKRRAEVMHADYALESKPGEGTRMRLFIPAPQLNV
jgi:signal transduction histidine kinase